MSEWVTLIGVVIAVGIAAAAQLLVNRGEPAAIKRITLLNEAIDGLADDDAARKALVGVRSKLVAQLTRSLIGLDGVPRVLRTGGWALLAVGLAGLFLSVILMSISDTGSGGGLLWIHTLQFAFTLVVCAPVALVFSAIWPNLVDDVRAIRNRITARGYGKIRAALTVDIANGHEHDVRAQSTVAR